MTLFSFLIAESQVKTKKDTNKLLPYSRLNKIHLKLIFLEFADVVTII